MEQQEIDNISQYKGKEMLRIVVIIDKYYLLKTQKRGKELDQKISPLVSVTRAFRIHCIVGIQRPDADSLHIALKANLDLKMAFKTKYPGNSQVLGAPDAHKIRSS